MGDHGPRTTESFLAEAGPNTEIHMKNRYLNLVGASITASLLSLVGSASALESEGRRQVVDTWLTSKTMIALAADSRVKGRHVSVATENSVVVLRGKVDNATAKKAAKEIAKGIQGVRRVDNQLQVIAPEKRDSVDASDESISTAIKERIGQDAVQTNDWSLKSADIGVATNAGIVSLTGNVLSIRISAQASWTAWQIRGVRSVKNDLVVSPGNALVSQDVDRRTP